MDQRRRRLPPSNDVHNPEPQYTVFVRLPFARGDFVDPPQVNWDTKNDHDLWDTISRTSTGQQVDCVYISAPAMSSTMSLMRNREFAVGLQCTVK